MIKVLVHHFSKIVQRCSVSPKVAYQCLDGTNSTFSSEKLGKQYNFHHFFLSTSFYLLPLQYRAMVVFGLNALSGKTIGSDGSATGAWNSSNAESLIRYTVNKGYSIHGWELGK